MEYQNQRSWIGRVMFNLLLKESRFLMKHMWLYYLLNYTWGFITTLIGWIALGVTKLFLSRKIVEKGKFGPCRYDTIFDN